MRAALGVQLAILIIVVVFDVEDFNNSANSNRAGGCQARDPRSCPRV